MRFFERLETRQFGFTSIVMSAVMGFSIAMLPSALFAWYLGRTTVKLLTDNAPAVAVVAAIDIAEGTQLTDVLIAERRFPEVCVPSDSLHALSDVTGKSAARSIPRNTLLRPSDIR
jgi:hypothetical protein